MDERIYPVGKGKFRATIEVRKLVVREESR